MTSPKTKTRNSNRFTPYQLAALTNPYQHFAFFAGVGSGKSYTGSHFAINQMIKYPRLSGFVGANSYDQLSQATLRELLYWLDERKIDWVIDCRPPASWSPERQFKSYKNILSVNLYGRVVTVFTRVLSDDSPLRGMEFSWYWIDETRDTPRATHDTILARLRESDHIKGLITTTTNGEDWVWDRFVNNAKSDSKMYGSMHVETKESVKYGIVSQDYYNNLLTVYSKREADQELRAMHVNTAGKPAYCSFGEWNLLDKSPFVTKGGSEVLSPYLPICVGLDFNLSPMSWNLAQFNHASIYFFDEIHLKESHTQEASVELAERVLAYKESGWNASPNLILCGDATGNSGQRAAAGKSDYDILCSILDQYGITYENRTPASNPRVKDRVNTVNTRLQAADDSVRMFLHPGRCTNLKRDLERVVWKEGSEGITIDKSDQTLTHMSDGAGYLVCELMPIDFNGEVGGLSVVRRQG